MTWCEVTNQTSGMVLARARLANTFARRLVGLLGQPKLPSGEGLVLVPARGVHTLGMRFSIDALHLDAGGRLLLVSTLPPGRVGPVVPGCRWVVELPAGTAAATGTVPGHQVKLAYLPPFRGRLGYQP
ncbi:MAG: DUF192 domain-containing protein [Bacillota bacterium]